MNLFISLPINPNYIKNKSFIDNCNKSNGNISDRVDDKKLVTKKKLKTEEELETEEEFKIKEELKTEKKLKIKDLKSLK